MYNKEWYLKNKDKWSKYQKEWRKNNPGKNEEYQKKWRDKFIEDGKNTLKEKYLKNDQDNPELYILNRIKSTSKCKNIDFDLDIEDIKIPDLCPILKIKLSKVRSKRSKFTPSIDRIDPNKGYIKGNIQIISELANKMKNNATKEELIQFAKSILEIYDKKI